MGRVIAGRYEEVEQLGQGSQGVVYRVRHVEHKTDLALKVLPSYWLEDGELVARFEQEAQMMTRLQHRNIARVLGTGRDEELQLHFIVMEYIQGKNLKQHLREKGALPLSEVLEIARQIAGALDYAHNQSPAIIHRDIKPTNIMIEDFSERVVVLDFGIAKELGESKRAQTRTGVMLGTWKYCAPEQLRHEPLSGSADVYSLGMVMYEMYTGVPFFSGLDEHAVLGKVLLEQREHEPYFARHTLPAFVTLVSKAIVKSREKRYRRMADLLNDLEACWWALDDTRTMVLLPQTLNLRPSLPAGEDVAGLNEQIRHLEVERQRMTLTTLQEQVRAAKEQAERNGARQWAPRLFEQGLAQETEGETQSRAQQYSRAQSAYEAAVSFFIQSQEEAQQNAAAQQIEKARQDSSTAKADAERAGAQAHANEMYAQALATVTQADQSRERQLFSEAESLYRTARHLFEDARDLAYREMQKGEAEKVREQVDQVRTAALADGVATLAAPIFAEGQANEQRAALAIEQEDFTQARRFYIAAQQRYEHAQRQAKRTHQRQQEVRALATQAQALQQQALAAGARVQRLEFYSRAEELLQQAAMLFEHRDYTRAGQMYTDARDLYEASLRAVEQELLQERAVAARDAAATAQQQAATVAADRWFPEEWNAAQKEEETGKELVGREQWEAALQQYQQLQQRWETLRDAGEKRQQQAQAEQAQHAMLREAAELAQTAMQVAQKAAMLAQAETFASKLVQEAAKIERQADAALAHEDFVAARQHYETAQSHYGQAETQARVEQQRQMHRALIAAREAQSTLDQMKTLTTDFASLAAYQDAQIRHQQASTFFAANQYPEAETAYQQARKQYEKAKQIAEQQWIAQAQERMQTARAAAVEAEAAEFCPEEWTEAKRTASAAQQFLDQRESAQAVTAFQQAEKHFTHLKTVALQRKAQNEEQQRQRAQEALQLAEERRIAAEQVEALLYVAPLYEQAQQQLATGKQHLQARRWQDALSLLTQAQELFATAAAEAPRKKAQQAVETARQKALIIQQETQAERGPIYFPERFAQALALLRRSDAAFQREDFSLAQRGFEEAAFLLQHIRHTAAVREKAEAELAAISLSDLSAWPEEISVQPSSESFRSQPPVQQPMPPAVTTEQPPRNHNRDLPSQARKPTPPSPRLEAEAPRTTTPPRTIPSITLSSRKAVFIGTVLLLAVISGYLLRSRPVDEAKTLDAVPEQSSTPLLDGPSKKSKGEERRTSPNSPAAPPEPASPTPTPELSPKTPVPPPREEHPVTPPAPPSLAFQRTEPGPGEEFSIREGETLPFAVTVADAGTRMLQYRWTLNGIPQSTEATWRYKPKFDEAEDAAKTVHVSVSDAYDQTIERTWRVRVIDVNRAPIITTATPRPGVSIEIDAGATQHFSVSASDPDKQGPLTHRWFIDGDEVGGVQTGSWQWRAPGNGGTHKITVEIQDFAGEIIRQSWDIVVAALPPALRWVRFRPQADQVQAQAGQPVEFTVLAELSGKTRGAEAIQYEWRVNDTVLQTEESGQFQFSEERSGRYQVSVVASNADGAKSPSRKWRVEVRALEPAPPSAVPEERPLDSRAVERCKNEARTWLESYRRASEKKDVRTLALLGSISWLDRDRLAAALKEYQTINVALTNVEIQCDSEPATVSFTRVDTLDGTTVVHPEKTVFQLEKRDGRLVARKTR